VTTEANPDSVTPDALATLAEGGFTRVSLGMQSAVPHVLRTLERTHDPANVARAVAAAKDAGLRVSVDLIYGTPGESLQDWRTSLEAATALKPDHVSAYALVVEEGTKLAAQVRRGQVPAPEDDDEAAKYELADELLATAGFGWYEVSNWARTPQDRCRHNEGYWAEGDWWGVGPGAHSHVGGVRWWNVKHPNAFAGRLSSGQSPAAGRELLTDEQRYDERVLLGVRLVEGLPIADLRPEGREAVAGLIADGLVDGPSAMRPRRVVLTRRGRLLADTVVRRLLGV
jgi:oxygen-independent coproporphyrinogen-3 oxidase